MFVMFCFMLMTFCFMLMTFCFILQFHGLYFLSYFLAMVGVIMFSARKRNPRVLEEPQIIEINQINVNDNAMNQDTISR